MTPVMRRGDERHPMASERMSSYTALTSVLSMRRSLSQIAGVFSSDRKNSSRSTNPTSLAEAERLRAEFDKSTELVEKLSLGRNVESFLDRAADYARRVADRS